MPNATSRPRTGRRGAVLVTGGAGFIGTEVVRQLRAADRTVIVVDRLGDARREHNARALRALGTEVVVDDLALVDLGQLFDRVDRVIHLAARPGVQASWGSDFDDYLADNVAVTARLLDAAVDRGHLHSVVLASSSSVYGEMAVDFVDESQPVAPVSPYGVTKAAVELLAGTYAARGLPVASLRYFTVYGRGQRPDMAISRMIRAVHTGEPFFVRGDGRQERDFTHVADIARATVAAGDAALAPGSVLNVGSGRPVPLLEVIREVGRLAGRDVPVAPAPDADGDPARTAADHHRATQLLGWRPQVELGEGLTDQIAHAAVAAIAGHLVSGA